MTAKVFIEALEQLPDQGTWCYDVTREDVVSEYESTGLTPISPTEGILLAHDLDVVENGAIKINELGSITIIVVTASEEVVMKGTVEDPRSAYPAPEAEVVITSIHSKRKPTRVSTGLKTNLVVSADEDDYDKHLIDPASTAGTAFISGLGERDNINIIGSHTRVSYTGAPVLANSASPIGFLRSSTNLLKDSLANSQNDDESETNAMVVFKTRLANQLDTSNGIISHMLNRFAEQGDSFKARFSFAELRSIFGISPDDIVHGSYTGETMFSEYFDERQWLDNDLRKEIVERYIEVLRHVCATAGIAQASFTAQSIERDPTDNSIIHEIVNGSMSLYSSYGNTNPNTQAAYHAINVSLPWVFGNVAGVINTRIFGSNILAEISLNDYDNGIMRSFHYTLGIAGSEAIVLDTAYADIGATSNRICNLVNRIAGVTPQPDTLGYDMHDTTPIETPMSQNPNPIWTPNL